MSIETIIKEELVKAMTSLDGQINDPIQKLALQRISMDLAMLPVRMAKGEDVSELAASLRAEMAMRDVALSLKAQAAIREAWMNVIVRIIATAIILV